MDVPVIGANTPALPGISAPPLTVLGYRADGRPIHPIAGGAPDDDDADVDIDDTADDDTDAEADTDADAEADTSDDADDDDDAPPAKPGPRKTAAKPPAKPAEPDAEAWVPPSREETERMRRTLAARKQEKLDLQRQLNDLRARSAEAETESEKAVRLATEQGEAKYKAPLVRTAARGALIQAGALAAVGDDKEKGEARLRRLLKLVDIDELSIDQETGDVLGLDEQIDAMRADYPELFTRPEAAPKIKPRPTAAAKPAAPDKPKSSWEQHAQAALKTS